MWNYTATPFVELCSLLFYQWLNCGGKSLVGNYLETPYKENWKRMPTCSVAVWPTPFLNFRPLSVVDAEKYLKCDSLQIAYTITY
jgi:hypothetical protein